MNDLYVVEVTIQGGNFHGMKGYARGIWKGFKDKSKKKSRNSGAKLRQLVYVEEPTMIIDQPPELPQAYPLKDAQKIAKRFSKAGYLAEIKPVYETALAMS